VACFKNGNLFEAGSLRFNLTNNFCDGVNIKTQCHLTYDGPLIVAKDLLTTNLKRLV